MRTKTDFIFGCIVNPQMSNLDYIFYACALKTLKTLKKWAIFNILTLKNRIQYNANVEN